MDNQLSKYHFRKFSPIDREYPIFELVNGNNILLDISATDDGQVEVCFHEKIANFCASLNEVNKILAEGKALIEEAIKESSS